MIDDKAVWFWVYAAFCFFLWTFRFARDRSFPTLVVYAVGALLWPLWPIMFLLKNRPTKGWPK